MKLKFALALVMLGLTTQAQLNQYQHVNGVTEFEFDPAYAPFYHGVASGDPLSDAVIIWTRITDNLQSGQLTGIWEVSPDHNFNFVQQTGPFTTDANQDYTVKVDVTGLSPNSYYYYRFIYQNDTSIVGRTKTAAVSGLDRMRMGIVSCINFQAGYFNGLRRLSERNDIDLVLCLGDYIYEYAEGGYGYDSLVGRGHEPNHEMVSLEDYRLRYSFYKMDPDLRRAHQLYPFVTVWDDHESTNDSWMGGAENHQPATEGDWEVRKSNMSTAYHEWMPIRTPDMMNKQKIYRSFEFGDLFDLFMIDTRIIGREEPVSSTEDAAYQDPNRSMLGADQYQWLVNKLKTSTAKYKILGNQVMMTQFNSAPNSPFNFDAWDGFPAERDSLMALIQNEGIENFIVLTGDIHTSWASDLSPAPNDPLSYVPATGDGSLGVEFVTPSITSDNFNEITGTPAGSSAPLEQGIPGVNPQIKFVELDDHGYLLLDIDSNRAQAEWYVGEILQPDTAESLLSMWKTDAGSNRLSMATQASQPKPFSPVAPIERPEQMVSLDNLAPVIMAAYPNPFTTTSRIQFGLAVASKLNIELTDIQGRVVMNWSEKTYPQGVYSLDLNGADLPAATYLLSIRSEQGEQSIQLIKN